MTHSTASSSTRKSEFPARGVKKPKSRTAPATSAGPALRTRLSRAATFRKSPPRYFAGPQFGEFSKAGGGTSMRVTIGPGQGDIGNYGSRPAPNTPSVMKTLLREMPSFGWVAGHLLNDNLGGQGEACNLTPLTTAGNKNHLNACETKIKNFINAAYRHARRYPDADYWYGVDYSVLVSDTKWGDDGALLHVAQELEVLATVIKFEKASGRISTASKDETGTETYFEPIHERVDNTGYRSLT